MTLRCPPGPDFHESLFSGHAAGRPRTHKANIEPDLDLVDDEVEEESSLPSIEEDAPARRRSRPASQRSSAYAKLAPAAPGVYRMIDAKGEVLYVGKAKSIRKRIVSYARQAGHTARIMRMIAATARSSSSRPRPKPRRCFSKPT